jgi:molybdenum cofactor synthesis domain-containing protein
MISPEEAFQRVIATVQALAPVRVPLDEALGHVLAAEVRARENMPPFRSSSMDGYAVIAADTLAEREVLGEQDAGHVHAPRVRPGTAVRIMTGAALPEGADAVIPVEYASEDTGRVRFSRPFPAGANIRPVGQDLAAGELILSPGLVLGAAEVGLLATLGQAEVEVHPRPRVAIMATGDELVPLGQAPGPGQIRDSNSHALAAFVRQVGGVPVVLGIIHDDEDILRRAILDGLSRADMLVSSGGVSMGRRDLIKPILEALGTIHFGRLAQKPGKPTTFATVQGKPFFGLPGFPVSSLVSAELYVRPALRKMAGFAALRRLEITVRLAHDIRHEPDRMEFQRAVVTWQNGQALARNTGDQVSGRLLSLVGANALLRLPQGVADLNAGDEVSALLTSAPEV